MVRRRFWLRALEEAWRRRSVVWLFGVRRVGKTVLCRSLPGAEYLDCELPRTRRRIEDAEGFLAEMRGRRIVLDEIHRLPNPSEVLKIAADHFPDVRVVATGSSTLGASARFRDTLAGRKADLWLTPMISADLEDFGRPDLRHRFLAGGLPPFFMAAEPSEAAYQEWMDAYWAKDVQELFRLERRHSFQRLVELLLAHSGGIFEATALAAPCEISRATVTNYLAVLEATHVVSVVRPFSTRRSTEIVAAPKVYGFDTGFVCFHRGWQALRPEDMGILWEHYVLNELQARLPSRVLRYWRDKRGHEVDFVVERRGSPPVAVECKGSARRFDPSGIQAFRKAYPEGANLVAAPDVDRSHVRREGGVQVRYVSLDGLVGFLSRGAGAKPPSGSSAG